MALQLHRLVAVVLLLLLLLGASMPQVEAQESTATTMTRRFLNEFTKTIPYLAGVWTGTNYCDYTGVTCDADGYVRIHLNTVPSGNTLLSGKLPDADDGISLQLVQVREINLNGLTNIVFGFPSSWAGLVSLETLDLSGTSLGGSIPDSWNGMRALKSVAISGTRACRGLPSWSASSLPLLQSVDLSNNRLTGSLSNSFGTFGSRLSKFDISGNSFCGCLPNTWNSSDLIEAARAANPNVVASNCFMNNRCGSNSFRCLGFDAAYLGAQSSMLILTFIVAITLAVVYA